MIASGAWDSRRILIDCDGYSYAMVAISGSMEGHDPRRQFRRLAADQADNNIAYMVALASAFESAFKFEGVDES